MSKRKLLSKEIGLLAEYMSDDQAEEVARLLVTHQLADGAKHEKPHYYWCEDCKERISKMFYEWGLMHRLHRVEWK